VNFITSSDVPLSLEALERPVVSSATLFRTFSMECACKINTVGLKICCSKGRTLPYHNIYPSGNGLVVVSSGKYLLNGVTPIDGYTPPSLTTPTNTVIAEKIVLGYNIPYRILHAYAHPWGAMIVTEDCLEGLSIVLLVLP
jgi:hypothetical protein